MGNGNRPTPWTDELRERVKELWTTHSSTQIADKLREEGHAFTRNSIVGLVHRMGLGAENKSEEHKNANRRGGIKVPRIRVPRQPKEPREHKPRNRFVRSNGNSNHLRLIVSRESAAVIKIRCDGVSPRRLSLTELEPNDCRFPYGDGPFTFCGHPKMEGQSWCESHFHWTRGAA